MGPDRRLVRHFAYQLTAGDCPMPTPILPCSLQLLHLLMQHCYCHCFSRCIYIVCCCLRSFPQAALWLGQCAVWQASLQ